MNSEVYTFKRMCPVNMELEINTTNPVINTSGMCIIWMRWIKLGNLQFLNDENSDFSWTYLEMEIVDKSLDHLKQGYVAGYLEGWLPLHEGHEYIFRQSNSWFNSLAYSQYAVRLLRGKDAILSKIEKIHPRKCQVDGDQNRWTQTRWILEAGRETLLWKDMQTLGFS